MIITHDKKNSDCKKCRQIRIFFFFDSSSVIHTIYSEYSWGNREWGHSIECLMCEEKSEIKKWKFVSQFMNGIDRTVLNANFSAHKWFVRKTLTNIEMTPDQRWKCDGWMKYW